MQGVLSLWVSNYGLIKEAAWQGKTKVYGVSVTEVFERNHPRVEWIKQDSNISSVTLYCEPKIYWTGIKRDLEHYQKSNYWFIKCAID